MSRHVIELRNKNVLDGSSWHTKRWWQVKSAIRRINTGKGSYKQTHLIYMCASDASSVFVSVWESNSVVQNLNLLSGATESWLATDIKVWFFEPWRLSFGGSKFGKWLYGNESLAWLCSSGVLASLEADVLIVNILLIFNHTSLWYHSTEPVFETQNLFCHAANWFEPISISFLNFISPTTFPLDTCNIHCV